MVRRGQLWHHWLRKEIGKIPTTMQSLTQYQPGSDAYHKVPKPSKKELAAEKKKAEGKGRGRGRGAKQNAAPQQMSDLMPQHFTAAGGKGSPKTKMARIPKITERVSLPTPDSLGLAGMQVGRELLVEF